MSNIIEFPNKFNRDKLKNSYFKSNNIDDDGNIFKHNKNTISTNNLTFNNIIDIKDQIKKRSLHNIILDVTNNNLNDTQKIDNLNFLTNFYYNNHYKSSYLDLFKNIGKKTKSESKYISPMDFVKYLDSKRYFEYLYPISFLDLKNPNPGFDYLRLDLIKSYLKIIDDKNNDKNMLYNNESNIWT